MCKEVKFLNSARKIASLSADKKRKMGCIVVYKNKIIASGINSDKTHPKQKLYNTERFPEDSPAKLHAEIAALAPLFNSFNHINWSKVTLYIYRIKNNKPCGLAKPCPACIKLIKDIGIKKICYTTEDGYAIETFT